MATISEREQGSSCHSVQVCNDKNRTTSPIISTVSVQSLIYFHLVAESFTVLNSPLARWVLVGVV